MSEMYIINEKNTDYKLCKNMDCERFPPDWDPEEDTEETYQEGQWKKCCLCDGYFDDDGIGDILFIQEEPNNQEASCDLCGKENNIVQMKGTGQYICEAACDESDEEEESEEEEEESEDEVDENDEKIANCDLCCKDKSFETYYVFKRGRKQELFSCVKCWENCKTQLVGEAWTWTYHSFPGPAFFLVDKDKEEDKEEENEENNKCDECNIELDRMRDGSIDKNIRCNNCYWEDKEGKDSNNIIKPDYRKNKEEDERYVICDNCDKKIDCWNSNIFCLYKGDQNSPTEEITICNICNDDLIEEYKEDGYNCDDWDESEDEDDDECIFNYYICKYCDYITTNDDPDCNKCEKKMCMELFQATNHSEALFKKKNKNEPTICTKDCACDPKCNENEEEESQLYQLHNAYKKTIYATEQWNNVLKNGKHVRYEITTNFYWGTFEVELTEKEKNELLKKNEIILNDIPGCCFQELDSGCDHEERIVNEDNYTEEEKKEIHRLLYFDEDDKDVYDPECEDDVDESILEANDWSMDDTIYGIESGGCTLE